MWAVLAPIIIDVVYRILIALGVTLVAHTGIDWTFDYLWNQLSVYLGEMPADWVSFFNFCGGGEALNIILGAYTFSLGYKIGGKALQFASSIKGHK